jgi:hypothetical protein
LAIKSGTPVFSRDWIEPKTGHLVIEYNYRVFFLKCIEKTTPVVVEDLAHDALPKYEELFWAACERDGVASTTYDNLKYHKFMARSWASGTHDHWWDHYKAVREVLLNWAERYSLSVEWVLSMALDALIFWTRHFTRFEKIERFLRPEDIEAIVARLRPESRDGFRAEQAEREARVERTLVVWPIWPVTTETLTPERAAPRTFQYLPWDGFEVDRYRKDTIEKFKGDLDRYIDSEVKPKLALMDRVPVIKHPEWFEALALQRCLRMAAKEIAHVVPAYHKHFSVISKDTARAAKLIGLPPARRGRPPKNAQKTEPS